MTIQPLTGPFALIFVFGLACVLAGTHLLLNSSQLRRRGTHTWGTVLGPDPSAVRSLITFRTAEGQKFTVSSRHRLAAGTAVQLYYDPKNPQDFAIDNDLYYKWPYLLIMLGLGIIPLAWLL